ncbi:MAG: hypothetical protein O7E52_26230 [Candidatus Poribacteria bacterium]|nr:hypothetical protein [Candidatus Poribacteria bacterium]
MEKGRGDLSKLEVKSEEACAACAELRGKLQSMKSEKSRSVSTASLKSSKIEFELA